MGRAQANGPGRKWNDAADMCDGDEHEQINHDIVRKFVMGMKFMSFAISCIGDGCESNYFTIRLFVTESVDRPTCNCKGINKKNPYS